MLSAIRNCSPPPGRLCSTSWSIPARSARPAGCSWRAACAKELRAACREHRIHGEAVYALVCFEALCRKRAATVAVAERIRGFLASLQRDPRQRFDLGLLLG